MIIKRAKVDLLGIFVLCFVAASFLTTVWTIPRIFYLQNKVNSLTALKKHFYDFRARVMENIPVDYLDKVTLDDFDFEKYEGENENTQKRD